MVMPIEQTGSDDLQHPPATSSTTPSQDSTNEQTASSRQERALRYLERKRLRQEATLSAVPDSIESEAESEEQQTTDKMPVIRVPRPALKKSMMPDLPPALPALPPQQTTPLPLSTGVMTSEELQYWRRHRKLVQRRLVRKRIRIGRVHTRHVYARILLTLSCVILSLLVVFM